MERKEGKVMSVKFAINDTLQATFASHGPDHLCLIFWKQDKRVGSFCAEGQGYALMDLMIEPYDLEKGTIPVDSLEEAVKIILAGERAL